MENIEIGIALLLGTSIYFTMLFIVRIVENITDAKGHNIISVIYLTSISWGLFFYHIYFYVD